MIMIPSNPFSTRFLINGAIPFLFESGDGSQLLVDFENYRFYAQIVGPHGTGKTTLLNSFVPELEKQGFNVVSTSLHDKQRCLPKSFCSEIKNSKTKWTILVIDGYEQLGLFARLTVMYYRLRFGFGVLLTTHSPIRGVPVLYRTRATFATLKRLLAGNIEAEIPDEKLESIFNNHSGNLRLVFLDLYDFYETG